jgi:hypothetical protein
MTRRKLFATLFAPLVAKLLPKPKANALAWRENGDLFYSLDFGREEITSLYCLSPLDKRGMVMAGWSEVLLNDGDKITISQELLHSIGFRQAVGPGYLHKGVLTFTEEFPASFRTDPDKTFDFLSATPWGLVPMGKRYPAIDHLSALIEGAANSVRHKTA